MAQSIMSAYVAPCVVYVSGLGLVVAEYAVCMYACT